MGSGSSIGKSREREILIPDKEQKTRDTTAILPVMSRVLIDGRP